jgi:hypothetical protein
MWLNFFVENWILEEFFLRHFQRIIKLLYFFFLWPLINRCYNLYNIYGMYPIWDVSYDIHVSEQFNYIIVSEAILYISKNSYQIPNL